MDIQIPLQNLAPPYFSSLTILASHPIFLNSNLTEQFLIHASMALLPLISLPQSLPLTSYLYTPTIIPSRTSIHFLQLNVQVTITMKTFLSSSFPLLLPSYQYNIIFLASYTNMILVQYHIYSISYL